MPRVSEGYLENRRQAVLDAAVACFARNGFAQSTIKDIAREAGVSYGVVYHYFRSKEEIVAASVAISDTDRAARFDRAERHDATDERLAEYLHLTMGRWDRAESKPVISVRTQVVAECAINESMRTMIEPGLRNGHERLSTTIQRGQARREVADEIDADAMAWVLLALNEGLVALEAMGADVDVERYIEAVRALVAARIGADGGKAEPR